VSTSHPFEKRVLLYWAVDAAVGGARGEEAAVTGEVDAVAEEGRGGDPVGWGGAVAVCFAAGPVLQGGGEGFLEHARGDDPGEGGGRAGEYVLLRVSFGEDADWPDPAGSASCGRGCGAGVEVGGDAVVGGDVGALSGAFAVDDPPGGGDGQWGPAGEAEFPQRRCAGLFERFGQSEAEVALVVDEVGGGRLELTELVTVGGAAAGAQETGPGGGGLAGPAGAQVGVEDGRGGAGLGALDGAAGDVGGLGQGALGQPGGAAQGGAPATASASCSPCSATEPSTNPEPHGLLDERHRGTPLRLPRDGAGSRKPAGSGVRLLPAVRGHVRRPRRALPLVELAHKSVD
jgi:hypothetical protein